MPQPLSFCRPLHSLGASVRVATARNAPAIARVQRRALVCSAELSPWLKAQQACSSRELYEADIEHVWHEQHLPQVWQFAPVAQQQEVENR
jgi:hypothetical protein